MVIILELVNKRQFSQYIAVVYDDIPDKLFSKTDGLY